MPRVIYAPEADDDLIGIADFIARDKPEAARRWVQRIRDTCATLATQPEMGELRKGFGKQLRCWQSRLKVRLPHHGVNRSPKVTRTCRANRAKAGRMNGS